MMRLRTSRNASTTSSENKQSPKGLFICVSGKVLYNSAIERRKHMEVKYAIYRIAGDPDGYTYSLKLNREDDACHLFVRERRNREADVEYRIYEIDPSLLENVYDISMEFSLDEIADRPAGPFISPNASVSQLKVGFEDGEKLSIDSYLDMNMKEMEGFHKVTHLLVSLDDRISFLETGIEDEEGQLIAKEGALS